MVCQLALQSRLDHPARELRQQAAGARYLLRVKALQRVRELVRGQQARKPVHGVLRWLLAHESRFWRVLRLDAHGGPLPAAPVGNPRSPYGLRGDPQPATTADRLPRPHTKDRTDPSRDPVPLTAAAEIKANSKPRMLAALPAITFPYPDDTLTQRRLTIALGYLRDNAHLRVHADEHDPHRPKLRLGVTGDLAATLAKDTTTNTTTTGCANYREEEQALCARALGEALAGQSVSLVSFGRVLHGLIGDAIGRYTEHPPPQALPLYGLLPGWLRGELQIGSSRGKPTAIRFIPSQRSSAQQACALANQLCETHSVKDHCQTDESTERGPDDITYGTRYKWCAREPLHFIGGLGSFEQPDLTSTLDSSAHAVRIPQL